jgi:pimeloyl-ACP methyl ester carboxylesterase
VREGLADKAAAAMPVQFAAHVGTTAPTIPTGQPGRAAGHSPQECGPGNAGEGQSYAATNSQSDRKGPPTGLSAGDPPASDSAGSQHPADWDGTVGDCGGNTRLDVIKRQISEALKNKRAIALVGGAADDSTNGPVAQIKKDMEKKYPGVQIQYFTHDQGEELAQWLREQGQVYGSNNVAVIGHSWGGDTAATVVAHGVNVGALVTIDPVSNFPPDLGDVKANARNWININANPDRAKRAAEGSGPGNWIAGLGGAWNDDPKDYADHHYNANINHAGVWELLPP